jgi:Trp operon repressor
LSEAFDVEMNGSSGEKTIQQELTHSILQTLASLTSEEETCRKKLIDNKKIIDELLSSLKSQNRDIKLAAATCLVSLLRSDKMVKSILLEAGDFHKELINMFVTSDKDHDL